MDDKESEPLTWEEQEEEIRRLNSLAIKFAGDVIEGADMEVKFVTKSGDPVYTTKSDGIDMLSRCSSIAKQWTAERRQSRPKGEDDDDVKQASAEDLMKAANK